MITLRAGTWIIYFLIFLAAQCSFQDLSYPTRDPTQAMAVKALSPNQGPAGNCLLSYSCGQAVSGTWELSRTNQWIGPFTQWSNEWMKPNGCLLMMGRSFQTNAWLREEMKINQEFWLSSAGELWRHTMDSWRAEWEMSRQIFSLLAKLGKHWLEEGNGIQ